MCCALDYIAPTTPTLFHWGWEHRAFCFFTFPLEFSLFPNPWKYWLYNDFNCHLKSHFLVFLYFMVFLVFDDQYYFLGLILLVWWLLKHLVCKNFCTSNHQIFFFGRLISCELLTRSSGTDNSQCQHYQSLQIPVRLAVNCWKRAG